MFEFAISEEWHSAAVWPTDIDEIRCVQTTSTT